MIVRIDASAVPLTLFTGRNPVSTYTQTVIRNYAAYLDRSTLVPYDWWYEYYSADGVYWGMDDDPGVAEIRVDGGFLSSNQVVSVGQTFSFTRDMYENGLFVGQGTFTLDVLAHTNVTVPAGSYADCLLLRFTMAAGGTPQVWESWMAKGVGQVKQRGVSGPVAPRHWDLIELALHPWLTIGITNGAAVLTAWSEAGKTNEIQFATNLVGTIRWFTQTNFVPLYTLYTWTDWSPTNSPQRFYRVLTRQ